MFGRVRGLLIIGAFFSFALPSDDIYDQKGYYLFPIRPGEINYLSGSMGELRTTHFHTGIDIKTGGVQGYNVYSAADGHLNRVKVSIGGYGKALYLQHPNNTFTVYAHLRDFSKNVADYVRRAQYRKKSYEVDLFPGKSNFTFNKGDIIAASGNTGSSSAPHLHFEIRDENHKVLDPLRFDFPEIIDTRVPEVRSVAFRTLDINSRVNGQFGRYDFKTSREENTFSIDENIDLNGRIGVEIYAFDRQNDTNNRYGLPCVEFYQDDTLIFTHHIKVFSFSDRRDVLVHTNYEHMLNTRRRYHKLYIDDGNEVHFYDSENRGIINITDTGRHTFKIKIWDVKGNFSETLFSVNQQSAFEKKKKRWYWKQPYRIVDNTLEMYMNADNSEAQHMTVYANRFQYELEPAYISGDKAFYLWDLQDGLPDSVDYCGKVTSMNFKSTVPAGAEFTYFSDRVDLKMSKRTLFDTLYLQTSFNYDSAANMEVFHFNHPTFPLRSNARITLKPQLEYPDKEISSVYVLGAKGKMGFIGGEWEGNEISFKTRELVDFTIAIDSVPPIIKKVRVNANELRFVIDDELSGVASFDAFVNGQWVLMNYESKSRLIWSEKLDVIDTF